MPPLDRYAALGPSASGPTDTFFQVAPSDNADLPRLTTALYVGSAGSVVAFSPAQNANVRFANVPAGAILPIRTSRVLETGTTAADIVGLA